MRVYITVLSLCLLVLTVVELLTGFLLCVTIPNTMLFLTGNQYTIGCGLVGAFVALPTSLRLILTEASDRCKVIYGYTLCYNRLHVCVCLCLHVISLLVTVISLFSYRNHHQLFQRYLEHYHSRQTAKTAVDNVQYLLQCCGTHGPNDWLMVDWKVYQNADEYQKRSIAEFLTELDLHQEATTLMRVPFSCCMKNTLSPCNNNQLETLGTGTINTGGCGRPIKVVANYVLSVELLIYIAHIVIEGLLFFILYKMVPPILPKDPSHAKICRSTNSSLPTTVAILAISSHEELTLSEN